MGFVGWSWDHEGWGLGGWAWVGAGSEWAMLIDSTLFVGPTGENPPDLRGVRLPTFCNISISLHQQHIKRGNVCQSLGPHNVGKRTFLKKYCNT